MSQLQLNARPSDTCPAALDPVMGATLRPEWTNARPSLLRCVGLARFVNSSRSEIETVEGVAVATCFTLRRCTYHCHGGSPPFPQCPPNNVKLRRHHTTNNAYNIGVT